MLGRRLYKTIYKTLFNICFLKTKGAKRNKLHGLGSDAFSVASARSVPIIPRKHHAYTHFYHSCRGKLFSRSKGSALGSSSASTTKQRCERPTASELRPVALLSREPSSPQHSSAAPRHNPHKHFLFPTIGGSDGQTKWVARTIYK
jgi:hypothetical protein